MLKKALLGILVLVLAAGIGLFVWGRSVLTQDGVRTAVAERLTQTLGQPVSIGGIGATVFPRVSVNLDNLKIGANIHVNALRISTDLRALISRRIEHGSVRLTGTRIQLPLSEFAAASQASVPPAGRTPGTAPVEIVSIDEIVLNGVEIVSGGRTLRGDIEVVPQGKGVMIRRVGLSADNVSINIAGQITDLSGPTGELTVKAGALDLPQLLAFVSDFSKGAGLTGSRHTAAPPQAPESTRPSAMNVAVTVDADRATVGTLVLERLSGRARITSDVVALEPIAFGIFGGRYEGTLALTLGDPTGFRLNAALSSVDMAAATKFAGRPNLITGRLSGTADVTGRGMDAKSVQKTARGTIRMDITDGVVRNLGLIQAVVLATSMRPEAFLQSTGSRDGPFTRLGGTLTIANGGGTTRNLRFESKDLNIDVTGAVRLDGSAVDLKGQAQLSKALSQQAGRDLLRYAQEDGRVTLPVTIRGSAENLEVRIDAAGLAKRAVRNRAEEETKKAITKGLRKLLGRGR